MRLHFSACHMLKVKSAFVKSEIDSNNSNNGPFDDLTNNRKYFSVWSVELEKSEITNDRHDRHSFIWKLCSKF